MNQAGTFVYSGETPGGCHLSNRVVPANETSEASEWQAPPAPQCVQIVAGGDPIPITVKGVAFSDILTYFLTRGDAGSLAPLDYQHYHGYAEARPLGESGPEASPKVG